MKKIYLAIILVLFSLSLCAFLFRPASLASIPELLPRAEKLGTVEEQDFIKQKYHELKNEIEVRPHNQQAYIDLAQLYIFEARVTGEHGHYYPAALKVSSQVLTSPKDEDMRFQALLTQASVYLSLHEFKKALQAAKVAQHINPHNSLVYGALVDAHVELGNYEEAVAMTDTMVAIRPDLRSYARISYLREIHGQVEGAIEAMQLAVAAALPGTEEAAWCQLILGKLYAKYDHPELAEIIFTKILAERKDYPFAIAELARIAMQQEKFEQAEQLLKQACEIIPEVGFYEELAKLYQLTDRKKEAKQLQREILAMLEDDEENGHKMTLEYAHVYRDLFHDYEKALSYAKQAYQVRPNNIDVNLSLASIYAASQQLENAKKHLAIAQKTGSKNPELIELITSLTSQE